MSRQTLQTPLSRSRMPDHSLHSHCGAELQHLGVIPCELETKHLVAKLLVTATNKQAGSLQSQIHFLRLL